MKCRVGVSVLVAVLLFSEIAISATLEEIESFTGNICGSVESTGEITRTKIKGELAGNAGVVAKLLGAEIEGSASVERENAVISNLDMSAFPAQFKDRIACALRLSELLIEEREQLTQAKSEGVNNGDECSDDKDCKSAYCWPGPHYKINGSDKKYCVAGIAHCAFPGVDGGMLGSVLVVAGTPLTCHDQGAPRAQFYFIKK